MEIKLTKGRIALVDNEDFEMLSKYKWCGQNGYAGRRGKYMNGKLGKILLMHRIIMNCPDDKEVDHINGNKLDNRKSNLRVCTRSQNNMNHRLNKNNRSGFKGISWSNKQNRWVVQIMKDYKNVYLRMFKSLDEAKSAYKENIKKFHGKFAPNINL